MKIKFIQAVATVAFTLFPLVAWCAVANVEFSGAGATALNKDGITRDLSKGSEIEIGDAIQTNNARAQLRFTDGGYISLLPNTLFKVDDYAFSGKQDGTEKSFFSLIKGGMRAITGLVGKTNKQAYRVNTAVATIGIRGTEYVAIFNTKLLVKVGDGAVYITNNNGDLILFKGQVGEVNGQNSKPIHSMESFSVGAAGPTGGTPYDSQTQENQDQQNNFFTVAEQTSDDGSSCVVSGGCPTSGTNNSKPLIYSGPVLVSYYDSGYTTFVQTESPSLYATLGFDFAEYRVDIGGNFLSATSLTDGSVRVFSGGQTVDKGYLGGGGYGAFAGGLTWARLVGGTFTDTSDGVTSTINNTNTHSIFGPTTPQADINSLATNNTTATYNFIGGTSPTDASGSVGSINSGALTVAFGTTSTVNLNMIVNLGTQYNVTATGQLSGNTPYFALTGDAYPSCDCSASYFNAFGYLSGSSAIRAALAYNIYGGNNGDITGVAAFSRK